MDNRKQILAVTPVRSQTGVTLIELMIAMVIIGILSAVAFPSYQSHVSKSRRSDATTMLTTIASQQEQHFLDNKTYTTNLTNLGFSSNPVTTDNGYYLVKVQTATTTCAIQTCYSIEAVPQNNQAGDSCGTLTMDSSGTKLPAGCW